LLRGPPKAQHAMVLQYRRQQAPEYFFNAARSKERRRKQGATYTEVCVETPLLTYCSCQRAQPRASSQYRLKERLVGSKAPSCGDQRTSNLSTPRPLHGCCELQPSHPYPIQSRGQRARDEGDWRGHGSGRDVSPPILLTPRPVAFSDGLVACKHVLLLSLTVIVSCFFTLMMALLAFSFPLFIIMWSDCSLLNLLCAPVNGAKILY